MSGSVRPDHAQSVFRNSCHIAPISKVSARTKTRPKSAVASLSAPNLPDSSSNDRPKTAAGDDWSGPAVPKLNRVQKTSPPAPPSVPPTELSVVEAKQPGGDNYASLFQTLLDSNCLLHKEITKLRRDHKRAMSRLTEFHDDRRSARGKDTNDRCAQCRTQSTQQTKEDRLSRLGHPPQACIKDPWDLETEMQSQKSSGSKKLPKYDVDVTSGSEECYEPSVMYDTPEEFHFDSGESDKLSVKSAESYQITYISSSSSSNLSMCSSRNGSPKVLVGKMWEGFSVSDYPVEDFSKAFPSKNSTSKKKQWAPKVTVPEPFSMTVRETGTIKKKTKSMKIAEQEQDERDALFDAKLQRKFRANPIPANTYLPLYDLINAKNEQRKELVKKMSGNMLRSSQKPFNFSQRDEEKKQQKSEWVKQAQEEEIMRFKRKTFKAKPIPSRLFDRSVDDEIEENQEYRKIRSRVRAEELLAKAKAPYSMRLQSARGGEKKVKVLAPEKRRSLSYRSGFTFQPTITHKIPDYKKTYDRLQRQLLLKKQSKLTTVSEPFSLHTQKRATSRQPVETDSGIEDKMERPPPPPSAATPYTPVMTETARRRQLLTQERLEEAMLKGAVEEEQIQARKKRQKDFQKVVAKKASALDLGGYLEEKKRHKMDEFRQKEKKNRLKYRQHLENIKKRVEARPLLLEQVSSNSVDVARLNYTTALSKVGFSKEEIQALLRDIESEDSKLQCEGQSCLQ